MTDYHFNSTQEDKSELNIMLILEIMKNKQNKMFNQYFLIAWQPNKMIFREDFNPFWLVMISIQPNKLKVNWAT